ncbi:site-specific DNA-methyltransferase [Paenibacillus polymyxa]|uniref:site-specific DNA-methyltransferase n=1 Tax=Paenibacillus TaxID=44249 RepID=UPI0008FB4238|nr:site-specific DNA-methyltransferase [Paenibacillus polymyxa]
MDKYTIKKTVGILKHDDATRKNIPTVEYQSVMAKEEQDPIRVSYNRRNHDLDPQLVWRGKDSQDWSDLVVQAPPLYIQEKVHPKVLIDDLQRRIDDGETVDNLQLDLFEDFNGLLNDNAKTEFYQHDASWTNRLILGDSLQVMASLTEREGLRGKVQCVYIDPPYGIKFNSNFQWSTTSRDVKDGNVNHITREPEQVKAFRDTWRDGIHSYLTYLRDRLTAARDLLSDTGCVVLQIGDENVHRARVLLDEVFGDSNFVCLITVKKTHHQESNYVPSVSDYLIVYAKSKSQLKYRPIRPTKSLDGIDFSKFNKTLDSELRVHPIPKEWKLDPGLIPIDRIPIRTDITLTQDGDSQNSQVPWSIFSNEYYPGKGRHWRTHEEGRRRLSYAGRVSRGTTRPFYIEPWNDKPAAPNNNIWTKNLAGAQHKVYVVQTNVRIVEQVLLTFSDPGDLVLDPTCGSGTTAYVAEQWGRRWITIDTSRVALALARARIMGATYPYYLLADSKEGQIKEAELTRTTPSEEPTRNDIRYGFVYDRVPHITLKSIANNSEIDIIWGKFKVILEPLRISLNQEIGCEFEEWEIPRDPDEKWSDYIKELHAQWWKHRIDRQKEIDASIAAKADFEYLYNKPFEDNKKVRVAGPFTVESLLPHRVLAVDENDELIEGITESKEGYAEEQDFIMMILENLRTAGVQQSNKEDKINFSSVMPWPGKLICAEGRYTEEYEEVAIEKRSAIFIGPEFGTVSRPDLVAAAREAVDAGFDVLIACAFNYDAHSSEFDKIGRLPVLKARMNADLHMADELKNNGAGNLFVIFGEPDIDLINNETGKIQLKINGVDVFHPSTGEVRSDGAEGIACWFIDTDYNEESFFVRHAYFLGADDPYKSLRTTLKAEINAEAWATLNSDTSRPFNKPKSGRIAVKVINHLGDEVMKVFRL